MYMCMHVYHLRGWYLGSQNRAPDTLKLELRKVISCSENSTHVLFKINKHSSVLQYRQPPCLIL